MPDVITCATCGTAYDHGKRRTQESVDDQATKNGWTLGWPKGLAYCPTHQPKGNH